MPSFKNWEQLISHLDDLKPVRYRYEAHRPAVTYDVKLVGKRVIVDGEALVIRPLHAFEYDATPQSGGEP